MGKTYHAPGKASQAPAGQAPGKPSTPSGRAPGKNVPRAFGPRTGETLTTHLRSTHWGGTMARAFGPSTLDNLPHASATRPGQTTRWGKTCRAPSGHAPGGKHATRRRATYQGKHATRLRSRKRKTCHMPLGHAPKETCRTPSGRALGSTCHSPSGHAPGESIPHAFGQCALGNLPTPPGHSSGAKHGTRIQAKRPGNPMTHFGH